jgi:hypothetical protein
VLVLVAAATGLLTPLLIGAAVGAQLFWTSALALHAMAMRHAGWRFREAPAQPARVTPRR